ncbi:hypothetical protein EHE19_011800 [Ruminiclostridium herbifermentans]|uniref:Uncharacterized protein n=1 Tax=Ruminiclostridium herbifermentans TaxID=2488810 RepID=A0A7H1VJP6_9FIRM|nr:hypothetical protein [Ruminiclostridium herbifermentans]QNU65608.1 hypothetical protein EHE19_011800 [Ruminiclostridium herbifermentans]
MYWDPSGHVDANLKDLALAAGANEEDIIWNGKNKENPQGSVTLIVNGVKKTIKVGENGTYISTENKIVIDNEVFDSLFSDSSKGLSVNTTISNGILTTQTVRPGNSASAPNISTTTLPYKKPSNRVTSNPSIRPNKNSGNTGNGSTNGFIGPVLPTQGTGKDEIVVSVKPIDTYT